MCKDLESKYSDLFAMADAPESELAELIGEVNARNFKKFLYDEADEIAALVDEGFTFESTKAQGVLSGMTFVITGSLMSGGRGQISALIESKGGTVKGSVSKGTNYLVVGEAAGNTKSEAAAKKGIKCISEQDLYSLMQMPMPDITDVPVDE